MSIEYRRKQEEFLAQHNLDVGSYVKVVKKAISYDKGWECCWVDGMDDYIGLYRKITQINPGQGLRIEGTDCVFPYYVCKPIDSDIELQGLINIFYKDFEIKKLSDIQKSALRAILVKYGGALSKRVLLALLEGI